MISRKGKRVLEPIRRVRFTRAALRQANIGEKEGPSLGKIQVKCPHQRSHHAMKIDGSLRGRMKDRSDAPAETRGNLPRKSKNLKKEDKATFYSSSEEWILPASTKTPEEREFVVDSGSSMHVVSKKDFNRAELETVRISKNPTMLVTANGEVLAREEATVYVRELDLFVTVMLLENTLAVLSLGKICEEFACSYHWTSGQKRQENSVRHIKSCTIRRTWFIHEFLYLINFSYIFIAGSCDRHGNSSNKKK